MYRERYKKVLKSCENDLKMDCAYKPRYLNVYIRLNDLMFRTKEMI